jgi:hypothetical protein
MMHRFLGPAYVGVLTCGLLVSAGCSRTDTRTGEASREAVNSPKTTGTASVRYVSALNAHSATDLYFGDTQLFSSSDATKGAQYKTVPAERRDFSLRAAGKMEGMEIEKNNEGLSDGKHYTVVAYEDKDAKPVLKVFNDDESAPDAGKAKVRLIHAAPGVDPVNLYAAGYKDKLAGESRFSTASTWQNVDPVKGPLEVRVGDTKTGMRASVPAPRLEAGNLYTFVVAGGPKSGEKLHVIDLTNAPETK